MSYYDPGYPHRAFPVRPPRHGRQTAYAASGHQKATYAVVEQFKIESVKLQLAYATLQTSADEPTRRGAMCTILRALSRN